MNFGQKLYRLRKRAGLTQRDVAERLEPQMSPQAVAKWEQGGSIPRLPALEQLADLFDCTISDLIDSQLSGSSSYLPMVSTAHMGAFDSDETDRMVEVPSSIAERHPRGRVMHGIGSCMNRRLPEDAVLVVDTGMEPRNGSIVVAERNGGYIVRVYSRGSSTLMLSADSYSDSYEDIIVTPDDEPVRIIGVVVWYQAYEDVHFQ